jgi:hypothetical protein
MSQTNDYSKRFFADFIAARLSARGIATEDTTRQPSQTASPQARKPPGAPSLSRADSLASEPPPIHHDRDPRGGPGSSS